MEAPAETRQEHVLDDGARVTLRMIRPEDGPALRKGFERLSSGSRQRRFLRGVTDLSDEMVRYLTEVDGVRHVAIVATADSHDLKTEVGLGVARFIRLTEEPDLAEVAITVADEAQGRGIGRLLFGAIVAAARERGIRALRAELLPSNVPMRRILDAARAVVRSDDGATLVLDVPLDAPPADLREGESPLRRLFEVVTDSVAALTGTGSGDKQE
jgi:GNAT superfamily N-acetyltransferase